MHCIKKLIITLAGILTITPAQSYNLEDCITIALKNKSDILNADLSLEAAFSNQNLAKKQLELVQEQFALHTTRKTDLLKSEVQAGQAEVEVVNAEVNLKTAYNDLMNAMGIAGQYQDITITSVVFAAPKIPNRDTALEQLEAGNPSLLANLKRYQRLVRTNEKVLKSAEADLELADKEYRLGSITILELLDAQYSVTSVRSNLIAARKAANLNPIDALRYE